MAKDIFDIVLDVVGLGGSTGKKRKGKTARLNSQSKKLDKLLADKKLEKAIETKKKRLKK